MNNNSSGQQDWQRAQQFEQMAQQAAQGEQKAREFNSQNSAKQTNRSQFQNVNQKGMTNQNIMGNNSGEQDWQSSEQLERQAQQAAQGEQKARNFNIDNSND